MKSSTFSQIHRVEAKQIDLKQKIHLKEEIFEIRTMVLWTKSIHHRCCGIFKTIVKNREQ